MFVSKSIHAQILEGVITDSLTGNPITPVSINNMSNQRSATVNAHGLYIIPAQKGDSLTFFSPGYKMITKKISQTIGMSARMNISLIPLNHDLDEVVIRGAKRYDYHTDSVEGAALYKKALDRTHPSPFTSPVSAIAEQFSRKAKEEYKFQKDFEKTETEKFIDTRYTAEIVSNVTGIKGDSVGHFMYQYPMPYDFARVASDLEVKMWIRNNYKAWIKEQPAARSASM